MAFSLSDFSRYRTHLYHLTHPRAAMLLGRERSLLCAAEWVYRANTYDLQVDDVASFLTTPRTAQRRLQVGAGSANSVLLNDQAPLTKENFYKFEKGCEHPDYVSFLNGLVFFWPGNDRGPKPEHAKGFEKKYSDFAWLRVPTRDLFQQNPCRQPCFCHYNSGAPQKRDRLTRGPGIFLANTAGKARIRKVVEVAFHVSVRLPPSSQFREATGSWRKLFRDP